MSLISATVYDGGTMKLMSIRSNWNSMTHVYGAFTLIRVLYEYGLPVTFTRTSSFCAGRVFIQPA